MKKLTIVATLAVIGLPPATSAPLYEVPVLQDFVKSKSKQTDTITFCINEQSQIRDFDKAVATAITETNFLTAKFVQLRSRDVSWPSDFSLGANATDIAMALVNDCDAIMGYPYPDQSTIPQWLNISKPYLSSKTIALERIDAPAEGEQTYGSIINRPETDTLRQYVRNTSQKWVPYSNNLSLISALINAEIDVAVIWEPAVPLRYAAHLTEVQLPYQDFIQDFGIAVNSNSSFLLDTLDNTISYLTMDETLDQLKSKFLHRHTSNNP